VAVIGCGGVGNAAIAGSSVAGPSTIIAVDIDDKKLQWARSFGATHTADSHEQGAVDTTTTSRRWGRSPTRPVARVTCT